MKDGFMYVVMQTKNNNLMYSKLILSNTIYLYWNYLFDNQHIITTQYGAEI
jgi:hypothetical protein